MPYYVTTPIYYVNGEPHLGHAYTTIAADVLARHMRQRGEDVFFLTGTDEHGEPVAQAAEKLGITPRELGDRNAVRFKELAARLNVTNDFFIRTTDPEHMAKVAEVVQRIHDNGHVYAGTYEGWYCPRCADFKTEAELEDGNRCPIHKIVLEIEKEDNWFFRLSAFQEPLEQLYAERPGLRHPAEPLQRGALVHQERPARPLAQPRAAQVGRAGAVGRVAGHLRLDRRAPQLLHGALLRARGRGPDRPLLAGDGPPDRQGHPQVPRGHLAGDADGRRASRCPQKVAIHGFLLLGEHKMSKSLGNVIEPVPGGRALRRRRAALLRAARGQLRLGRRGLAGGLRDALHDRARQRVRQPREPHAGDDRALPRRRGAGRRARPPSWPSEFEGLADAVCERARRASSSPRRSTRSGAGSSGSTATCRTRSPGSSPRTRPQAERLDEVLYTLAEGLRVVSVLLHPFMPGSAERLLAALGQRGPRRSTRARFGAVGGGARIGELGQLFPRVEAEAAGRLSRP